MKRLRERKRPLSASPEVETARASGERASLYETLGILLRHSEAEAQGFRIKHLAFLWAPYKPQFYLWEVVESARRLLLSAVLAIVVPRVGKG